MELMMTARLWTLCFRVLPAAELQGKLCFAAVWGDEEKEEEAEEDGESWAVAEEAGAPEGCGRRAVATYSIHILYTYSIHNMCINAAAASPPSRRDVGPA